MTAYVEFPVGDYSFDGHNYVAHFLVKTQKTFNDVFEVHYRHNSFLSHICDEFEDNQVDVDYLIQGCLEKENSTEKQVQKFLDKFKIKHNIQTKYDDQEWVIDSPELLVNLWIELLNWFDKELKLKIVSEALGSCDYYKHDPDGSMNYYDINSNKRIDLPGYGVWDVYCGYLDDKFYYDVS